MEIGCQAGKRERSAEKVHIGRLPPAARRTSLGYPWRARTAVTYTRSLTLTSHHGSHTLLLVFNANRVLGLWHPFWTAVSSLLGKAKWRFERSKQQPNFTYCDGTA